MKCLLICVLTVLCFGSKAQYSYFNLVFDETLPNGALGYALFVDDSNIVSFGSLATLQGDSTQIKKISMTGEVLQEYLTSAPNGHYGLKGGELTIRLIDGTFFTCGGVSEESTYALGYTARWNQEYELVDLDIVGAIGSDTIWFEVNRTIQLADENVLLTGIYSYNLDGETDPFAEAWEIYLLKRTLEGDTLWKTTFDYAEEVRRVSGLAELDNGEILMCGRCGPGTNEDMCLWKCDSLGQFIEKFQWGGEGPEYYPHMLPLEDGTFLVSSGVNYEDELNWDDWGQYDFHIMKFDPAQMDSVWDNAYTPEDFDGSLLQFYNSDFITTPDGGYAAMVGYSPSSFSYRHPRLLKFNSALELEWMKNLEPEVNYFDCDLYDLEVTSDGGFAANGYVLINESFQYLHWIVKTDACGDMDYNGCPLVSVEENKPGWIGSSVIYPNPATTTIHFHLTPNQEPTRCKVFSMEGKLVKESRVFQKTLNVEDLVSGIYLVQLFDMGGHVVLSERFAKE